MEGVKDMDTTSQMGEHSMKKPLPLIPQSVLTFINLLMSKI